jgi:caa(3)-type oxidase subunit IV
MATATQTAHAHDDKHVPQGQGQGHGAGHGSGPAASQEHSHVWKYLKVFFALIVLTGLELGVVYAGLPKTTLILLLIGLALAKAGAVALWFMHLADERRVLRLMVGLPLLFPPLYACVLIAEAFFRSRFM